MKVKKTKKMYNLLFHAPTANFFSARYTQSLLSKPKAAVVSFEVTEQVNYFKILFSSSCDKNSCSSEGLGLGIIFKSWINQSEVILIKTISSES